MSGQKRHFAKSEKKFRVQEANLQTVAQADGGALGSWLDARVGVAAEGRLVHGEAPK